MGYHFLKKGCINITKWFFHDFAFVNLCNIGLFPYICHYFNSSDLLKTFKSGLHIEEDVSLKFFGGIPSGSGVLLTFKFPNWSNTSFSVINIFSMVSRGGGQAHAQEEFYLHWHLCRSCLMLKLFSKEWSKIWPCDLKSVLESFKIDFVIRYHLPGVMSLSSIWDVSFCLYCSLAFLTI